MAGVAEGVRTGRLTGRARVLERGRRLIFLDFDGTYADHGVVPAGHVGAVRTVRAAGHRVFLCTGRPRSMIPGSVLVEFDGFVAAAGGYVDVGGRVLTDHRFPAHLASSTVSVLDEHDVAYLLEAPEAVYGPPGVDRRLGALLAGHLPTSDTPEREGPLDILAALRMSADLTAASFGKITCFDSPVPITSLVEQIGHELGVLPSSIPDMGDSAGEIHLTWVHKAVGMHTAAETSDSSRLRLSRSATASTTWRCSSTPASAWRSKVVINACWRWPITWRRDRIGRASGLRSPNSG